MKRSVQILMVAALIASPGLAEAASSKNKLEGKKCLTPLLKSLKGTLRKFPLKSQDQLRQQAIQTYTKDFQNCAKAYQDRLKELSRPVGKRADIFTAYLKSLKIASEAFRTKRVQREQQAYVQAVQKIADLELKFAKPLAKGTTLQDTFEQFVKRLKRVQFTTVRFSSQMKQKVYSSVQKMFMSEVKQSENGKLKDRTKNWEANAKLGRKEFPTSSAALKKKNERLAKLVEAAAKKVFDTQSKAARDADK